MKRTVLEKKLIAALLLGTAFLTGCGDDDFTPVSKNRGYDYAFTSNKEFADYPCNEMREGREAIVGRDKESYFCEFDEIDSVYIWAGYNDTLTAKGKEFVRKDASSSSEDEYGSSSSRYSSSYSSSSVFVELQFVEFVNQVQLLDRLGRTQAPPHRKGRTAQSGHRIRHHDRPARRQDLQDGRCRWNDLDGGKPGLRGPRSGQVVLF